MASLGHILWRCNGESLEALFCAGKQSYQEHRFSGIISALFSINFLAIKS